MGSAAHLRLLLTNVPARGPVGLLVYAATARPVFAAALTALLLCCARGPCAQAAAPRSALLPADLRALSVTAVCSHAICPRPCWKGAAAALAVGAGPVARAPHGLFAAAPARIEHPALSRFRVSLLAGRDPCCAWY